MPAAAFPRSRSPEEEVAALGAEAGRVREAHGLNLSDLRRRGLAGSVTVTVPSLPIDTAFAPYGMVICGVSESPSDVTNEPVESILNAPARE